MGLLAVLPSGYRRLFESAARVLHADQRVRAVWLGGSLARAMADRASDLDLLVAADDAAYEKFTAGWREWLAEITPTVIAEPLSPWLPGSFYSVTPGFERFDVVVESAKAVATSGFRTRAVVFDRDGLDACVPAAETDGPSPTRMAALIQEFFFHSAKLEVLLWRQDWLLGAEHAHWLRSVVYRLFVEANAPVPVMGLKQWSAKLNVAQQQALAAMPTDIRDADQVLIAHRAAVDAFIPTARRLADELDIAWPTELEAAATRHLLEVTGVGDLYSAARRAQNARP